jgi:hypothetical protein
MKEILRSNDSKLLACFIKKYHQRECSPMPAPPADTTTHVIISEYNTTPHPPDIEDKVPKRSLSTTSKGDTLKHISGEMSRKIFAGIEKDPLALSRSFDGAFSLLRPLSARRTPLIIYE